MKKQCGIYQIVNALNGDRYIGSSSRLKHRWESHKWMLRSGKHHSNYLQHAWDKYGEKSFDFVVVFFCYEEELIKFEQKYIDECLPKYNMCKIAGSKTGFFHTEESKMKISKALTGRNPNDDTRRRLSESLKGRVFTAEWREKISIKAKERMCNPKNREKLSLANKGHVTTDEAKKKLSAAGKGRVISVETRLKLSDALRGRVFSDEHRSKLSAAGHAAKSNGIKRDPKGKFIKGATNAPV